MIQFLNNLVTDGQTDGQMDRRRDRQEWFHTTLSTHVERPIMNIKSCYIHRMLKKAVFEKLLEKKNQISKIEKSINNQRRNFTLSRILIQMQEVNEDVRNDINKSVANICEEEGVSFEQVFYILIFDAVILWHQQGFKSRELILSHLIIHCTLFQQLYVCFFCLFLDTFHDHCSS